MFIFRTKIQILPPWWHKNSFLFVRIKYWVAVAEILYIFWPAQLSSPPLCKPTSLYKPLVFPIFLGCCKLQYFSQPLDGCTDWLASLDRPRWDISLSNVNTNENGALLCPLFFHQTFFGSALTNSPFPLCILPTLWSFGHRLNILIWCWSFLTSSSPLCLDLIFSAFWSEYYHFRWHFPCKRSIRPWVGLFLFGLWDWKHSFPTNFW